MTFELITIPCLSDNYAFLLHAPETGETAVIDVPDAKPILAALKDRNWQLTEIWLTHHHWDHIDGCADLKAATGAKVIGADADAHRLPPLNHALKVGETYAFAGSDVHIIDVPGHTVGHIALHVPDANVVFTADSLMALGCGRLFEGTPEQMWASLSRLAALPGETIICSGHEYTASNARFALTVDGDNPQLQMRAQEIAKLRAQGKATVPSTLATEQATNPFLRASDPGLKSALGMANATDAAVFAEIRRRKDAF
jgi:hydroxyacylglutathione hydrolase